MAQLFSLGIITLMHIIPFLRGADFVSTILVDTMVICFAFPAYRRTQMRAFGFLILGSVVGIILECGLQLHRSSPYTSTDDAVTFSELYRVGYLVAGVSWGIGIYQLIGYVMKTFDRKDDHDA